MNVRVPEWGEIKAISLSEEVLKEKWKHNDAILWVLEVKTTWDEYYFYGNDWKKLWIIVYSIDGDYISFIGTTNAIGTKFPNPWVEGQFQDYLWDSEKTHIHWLSVEILKRFFSNYANSDTEIEVQIENPILIKVFKQLKKEWIIADFFHNDGKRYSIITIAN